jgi:hypothetical protein
MSLFVADVHQIGAQQRVERDVVAHHADDGGRVIVERHEHRLIAVGPRRRHVADRVVVEGRILRRNERGGDRIRSGQHLRELRGGGRYAGDAIVHPRRLIGVGRRNHCERVCAEQRERDGGCAH